MTPGGPRPRDVLAVLLQRRGQSVAPEVILDLVWGHDATHLTVAAVHTVIARLRRRLGTALVETVEGGYRLADTARLDTDAFGDLLRRARTASSPDHSATLYREAIALWRSDAAYQGVNDDLVSADRARLAELKAVAVEDLATRLLDLGTVAAAEESLQRCTDLTTQHPLRERAHALAMAAAYRCGRQAEALELYAVVARRLRGQLGVDPGPLLAAVHAQILAHDPALAAPSGGVRRRGASGTRARCAPVPANPTVGRAGEIDAVLADLAAGWRLVTLVGPGGVGKSRVLAEVALRLHASAGVTYFDLAGLEDLDATGLAEQAALAFGFATGTGDPVSALIHQLGALDLVVLLDEAEWVRSGVGDLLDAVLGGCPGVRFVVTSRLPLNLVGERRIMLTPLDCPPEGAVGDAVADSAAVRLLVDRLVDQGHPLPTASADLDAVARIARRVDGLPLALELAAGHGATRTLTQLAELLENPLDVTDEAHGRSPRHSSLRQTLRWSRDRLDPPHQRALRRLGVFSAPFETAAAVAVIGPSGDFPPGSGPVADVQQVLDRLVADAHLAVDRRGTTARLRLLRTVRDLALEDLAAHGELDDARRRHRHWYAARWRGRPLGDDLVEQVRAEYENYLAALRESLAAHDLDSATDLVVTLARLWLFTEAFGPGVRWTSTVLQQPGLTAYQRARVLVPHAAMLQQSEGPGVVAMVSEAAAVLAASGDADGLGLALQLQAVDHYLMGCFEAAAETSARLVAHARTHAVHQLPEALSMSAVSLSSLGRRQQSTEAANEAWQLVVAVPSATHFASVVSKVALAHLESGQCRRALEVLQDAICGIGQRLDVEPTATLLINAGWAALGLDLPEQALDYQRQALARSGNEASLGVAEALLAASCTIAAMGRADAAQALDVAESIVRDLGLALSPWQVGQVELARRTVGSPGPWTPSSSPAERIAALRVTVAS